jgi:hypothetical protein
MKKYIIGLGCSWTQGEGGYPNDIVKIHNGNVNKNRKYDRGPYLLQYEHENSWVNVLTRDYFVDYTPINLGVRAVGNRAAVHQLHFCDKVDFNNSTGIIILLLTGFERFDFFQKIHKLKATYPDSYSFGGFMHDKWKTMWPIPKFGNAGGDVLNEFYLNEIWSEQAVSTETMMALLDLQTFAKAYGYKLVIANAFNHLGYEYLKEHSGYLVDKFDWDNYLHETTNYKSMVEKLIELDGILPLKNWLEYYKFYGKLENPSKYLTNCSHPTIEGYKVIAEELAKFIRTKYYI